MLSLTIVISSSGSLGRFKPFKNSDVNFEQPGVEVSSKPTLWRSRCGLPYRLHWKLARQLAQQCDERGGTMTP